MNEEINNVRLKFICPVNPNSMIDTEGGKFCNHCQKTVYDFTNVKADAFKQILAESSDGVCGKFTFKQLATTPVTIKPLWKKWVAAAVVILGFNLLNDGAAAQSKSLKKPACDPLVKNTTAEEFSTFGVVLTPPPYDELPSFPAGAGAFKKFIENNLRPVEGASGKRVFMRFNVNSRGELTDIKIVRGFNSEADKEAIRVLKLSPKWKPAMLRGKPVTYDSFNMWVAFK